MKMRLVKLIPRIDYDGMETERFFSQSDLVATCSCDSIAFPALFDSGHLKMLGASIDSSLAIVANKLSHVAP
jgi:hypothetical protein